MLPDMFEMISPICSGEEIFIRSPALSLFERLTWIVEKIGKDGLWMRMNKLHVLYSISRFSNTTTD